MEAPGYFSIITADVRYDAELNSNQKLLFSEITTLTQSSGVCWASNAYFARLYAVDGRTIQRWIQKLRDRGYISIKLVYKEDTKIVDKRLISILLPRGKIVTTPRDNSVTTPHDNSVTTPHDKSVVDNRTRDNRTRENNISTGEEVVPEKIGAPHQEDSQKRETPVDDLADPEPYPDPDELFDALTSDDERALDLLRKTAPREASVRLISSVFIRLATFAGSGMRRLNQIQVQKQLVTVIKSKEFSASEICDAVVWLMSPMNIEKGKYSIIIRRADHLTVDKFRQILTHVDDHVMKKKPKAPRSAGGIEGGGRRI